MNSSGRIPSVSDIWNNAERAAVTGDELALAALLREHVDVLRHRHPDYASGDARTVIATRHHFDNWAQFDAYREELAHPQSETAAFEAGVDAVIAGDIVELSRLLRDRPSLIHVRSARWHRATLLVYLGANGVEDFRQKTPANVIDVAEMLLRSGADVNAVATMYGGSTTLGLVATSVHPARAGVQRALMDILLAHGASFEGSVASDYTRGQIVNACLANGRGDAAAYLATRGAALDLEGACGVGRLDVVRRFIDSDGVSAADAQEAQLRSGFNHACQYGHLEIVDFLLRLSVDLRPKHHGETGLHWASFNAHTHIVRALLQAGFAVDQADDRWGSTPLGWAMHGWHDPRARTSRRRGSMTIACVPIHG